MRGPNKSDVTFGVVLYLGDPDDGAEALPSNQVLEQYDTLKDRLAIEDGLYGAITLVRDDEALLPKTPDPIVKLLTDLVRTLPYIIDGELETTLLSETQHGFLIEPTSDKLQLSFFRGYDAFDPEEFLVEAVSMTLDDFGSQLLAACDDVVGVLKKHAPEAYQTDDYGRDLIEMLGVGRDAFKSYRLEVERGLRH